MAKPILRLGTVSEAGTTDRLSDEFLKRAAAESQWQPGIARIEGVDRMISRRRFLDEVEWKYKDTLLAPSCIETFMPTEMIFGRDYKLIE